MSNIKIINLKTGELKPYANNPRKNDNAVEYVANSIREFGFKVPIVIDKNNVIVNGHTRYKAALSLGLENVPCIRADDLTDDQIKAYRIADNKVAEYSTWDESKLEIELGDILIDLGAFGVEVDEIQENGGDIDDGWHENAREATYKGYNLDLVDYDSITKDFWQMPIIRNDNYIPERLIGFNYAMNSKDKNTGIHFYVDDYQFERIWNRPDRYLSILKVYDCILSPDFSLYLDMPMPMKIWNTYRSRQIGSYYQSMGIKVIPTISWGEHDTYKFCFQGIPKGSIVSISTVGVKKGEALRIWQDGTKEMIKQIEPSAILVYGGKLEFDYGGIKVLYYDNEVVENVRKRVG